MDHTYFADNTNLPAKTVYESKIVCCVPQCGNRACEDQDISLHCFPKMEDLDVWTDWFWLFKLDKEPKYAYACSEHFCSDDFISVENERRLKPNAVPSRNLPTVSARTLRNRALKENRKEWSHKRQLFYQKILATPNEKTVTIPEIVVPMKRPAFSVKQREPPIVQKKEKKETVTIPKIVVPMKRPAFSVKQIEPPIVQKKEKKETVTIPKIVVPMKRPAFLMKQIEPPIVKKKDVSVQVESMMPILPTVRPKIMNLIQCDAYMQTCTNLTIKQFHTICEMVELFLLTIPVARTEILGTSSKVLLTLMKLKENHSFSHLAFLFDVDVASCSSSFYETIGILRQVLCQFITWPSREEIRRHLPKQFSNWPQTRVVIDCVEIAVYSSRCLKCSNSFCSHFKIKPTIKFLVGMAPSGPVIFLTNVYDGETPAKTILDECGLLNLCELGDTIIANRGFIVDEPKQTVEKPVLERSQVSIEEVKDIKSVVPNTRPVLTNAKALPGNTRLAAGNTILTAENIRIVPGNTRLAPGNARPAPGNTRLVPTNTRLVLGNNKPIGTNPRFVPGNTRPVVTITRPTSATVIPPDVHIKTVERIRSYEILNSPITSDMFDGIDLIVHVICALVNFTARLVGN